MAMMMGMNRVFSCQVSVSGRIIRSVGTNTNVSTAVNTPESVFAISRRWASKKAGGSTKNGRDSESKRLGVKKFGGYD